MGVFDTALTAGGQLLRDAAVAAAFELGLIDVLGRGGATLDKLAGAIAVGPRRLRALLDVLVAIGVLIRTDEHFTTGDVPACPVVPRAGWGRIADVIRTDRPLPDDGAEVVPRYHAHLLEAGAAAAREVAPMLGTRALVDLGGGAGVYTAAFLDAQPDALATLVDAAPVVALAAEHLVRFGDRVQLIGGDAREVPLVADHDAALLANVTHLHPPAVCAELCTVAARAIAPGGVVAIVDLRLDDGRRGPLESVMFALNMAIYTDGGDVHPTALLRGWLAAAGLVGIEERRLASAPETIVVLGYRPRGSAAALAEVAGKGDPIDAPGMAAPLRRMLGHALARERSDGADGERARDLLCHYTETMPRAREEQLAPGSPLFHAPLHWAQLPRLAAAIDRLFAVLRASGADPVRALGAATADAFRARTPTLAALYARTHYGGAMPLLYGSLADLAYFEARRVAGGGDLSAMIDRYLTTPILHELCHFGPERDALMPMHLDECVAGWLGVHVHPEFAYPRDGHDDAIFAAPWLAQIGQAIARAFGIVPLVRAHAGTEPWDAALPKAFVDAAARLGWDDWCRRRTMHFLSDTLDPDPWVALALVAGAGRSLTGETLASLARTPLVDLAATLPPDPDFDRAIVGDALRAMCLDNALIDGSFRTRMRLPDGPITIDARACRVTAERHGTVDTVAPRYWLPPAVAARIAASGLSGYELRLGALTAIDEVADAVCAATMRPELTPI